MVNRKIHHTIIEMIVKISFIFSDIHDYKVFKKFQCTNSKILIINK